MNVTDDRHRGTVTDGGTVTESDADTVTDDVTNNITDGGSTGARQHTQKLKVGRILRKLVLPDHLAVLINSLYWCK